MEESKTIGKSWITFIIVLIISILNFIFIPLPFSLISFSILFLPIIIYIIIYKWIKLRFASVVFTFSVWLNIIILIIPILIGFVAIDLMHFADEIKTSEKYILIEDKAPIFGVKYEETNHIEDSFKPLTKSELQNLKNNQKNKIIISLNKEVFRNVNKITIEDKITISKEDIFLLLNADEKTSSIFDKLFQNIQIEEINQFSLEKIKTMAFLLLMRKTLEENSPEFLIKELKAGNIKIYPERLSVKLLIKILPEGIASSLIKDQLNFGNTEKQTKQNPQEKNNIEKTQKQEIIK